MLPLEGTLVERLRRLEALHAGTKFDGEREAARRAAEKIRARLAELRGHEQDKVFRYSLPDPWRRKLFLALCRRYGLKPYREPGRRHSTVLSSIAPDRVGVTSSRDHGGPHRPATSWQRSRTTRRPATSTSSITTAAAPADAAYDHRRGRRVATSSEPPSCACARRPVRAAVLRPRGAGSCRRRSSRSRRGA